MTAAEDERWIGRTIDRRYRIVGLLGDGGMGSVYEAEHLSLGKRVAFKVIHPELVRDEEARARFEREARATAAIEHPHVAAAMDFGRLPDGGAYLVVQLVQGPSLRERIEQGAVPWREACAIGAQIADGLAAIHARGFVHRDLSAENVLITKSEDGSPFVHVLDLGVAGVWRASDGERKLTEEGHVVGTPGYMPPEQALGQPTDPRADLYALGVLLWEMCAGRSLFGPRELTQIVASQLTEEPPPIPELASASAPPELTELIGRLLARAPDQRPADGFVVRDALRRCAVLAPIAPVVPRRVPPVAWLAGAALAGVLGLVAVVSIALMMLGGDDVELTKEPRQARVMNEPARVAAQPAPPPVERNDGELFMRMLEGRYRAERHEAAEEIQRTPDVPPWVLAAANLELARTCTTRREALEQLIALRARGALPVIGRLRAAPRTGCGRGRRSDCYGCVRADAERAWIASGGAADR